MIYRDRAHAGQKLSEELQRRGIHFDALLALPRGGVPVAEQIALSYGLPVQVLLVRKLGVPSHRELAMGAIAEGGVRIVNESVLKAYQISEQTLGRVEEHERRELDRRRHLYGCSFDPTLYVKRTVLVVDDGLATGATMKAAVEALSQFDARKVLVAVPVASHDVIDYFESLGYPCVCPLMPEDLSSVGQWYGDFEQVSDTEVKEILERSKEREMLAHP